jgi:hypothetical protein
VLTAIAARLEKNGLEPVELACLQESYSGNNISIEVLIKEWEGDHKEPGNPR